MRTILGGVAVVAATLCALVWLGLKLFLAWAVWGLPIAGHDMPVQRRPLCSVAGQVFGGFIPDVPGHVRAALIAAEDPDFMTRQPLTSSAVLAALLERRVLRGSPFTLGVVRCLLSSQGDRAGQTLAWHLRGLALSVVVESEFSREAILDSYLEIASFGTGLAGIDAGARAYFRKSAADLSIAEAAYLAGLLRAPGHYGGDDRLGLERRNAVLVKMVEARLISGAQYLAALDAPLGRCPLPN